MTRRALAHARTIGARVARTLAPAEPPPGRTWGTTLEDPVVGLVRLTGAVSEQRGDRFLVLVHGLGGCADSGYMLSMARTAWEAGWTVLRLNLRGADRLGDDFYHAGLTADLEAALGAVPARYGGRVAIAGYSLGGHVALCLATEPAAGRVAAVAAVCPPLDLAAGADHLDGRGGLLRIYRTYLLRHLKEIYAAVGERREVPYPVERAASIDSIREWDERTVAPRHGFEGAADYYARASVGPRLGSLRRPALIVAAPDDPMVPGEILERHLAAPVDGLDVRWVPGGHVAFGRGLDLGQEAGMGLERQLLAWLEARLPPSETAR